MNRLTVRKDKKRQEKAEFLGAMLTGIASRSAATSKVHRLYRDGYAPETEFRAAIKRDAEELLSKQDHFAYVSAGQLDWLDIFRPIAKAFKGFAARTSSGEDSVGPVTRWFRTNTFYRKPLISKRLSCSGYELADAVPPQIRSGVIFLPAPYSFSRMVENAFYGTTEEMAMDYSKAVAKSIPKLHEKGYGCLLLIDPLIGYEQSRGAFRAPDWYGRALSAIKAGEVRMGVNFPAAEACEVVSLADSSQVDFIGIDAIFNNKPRIETGKDLLIGVLDGGRVGVESVKSIEGAAARITGSASFSGGYYIGPNDRLYDVPFEIALQKISALSRFGGV